MEACERSKVEFLAYITIRSCVADSSTMSLGLCNSIRTDGNLHKLCEFEDYVGQFGSILLAFPSMMRIRQARADKSPIGTLLYGNIYG
jgi:hypothetical protein